MPDELIRVSLAERFGWTFPEVDALTLGDIEDIIQVDDGRNKARGIGVPKQEL